MEDIKKLIYEYSSVYPHILAQERFFQISVLTDNLKAEIEEMAESEEKERQKERYSRLFNKKLDEFINYYKDFKQQQPKIYNLYMSQEMPRSILLATIQAGKKYSDALLYDIMVDPEFNEDLFERLKELSEISDEKLDEFIIKRDISERVPLLTDITISPNYVKSVEMARAIVKTFPNYCGNMEYLYKVNDLKGVEKFLEETGCASSGLYYNFYQSLRYVNDMKAYKHVITEAKKKGIDIDVNSTIFYVLQNRNYPLVLEILEEENVTDLSREEYRRLGAFSDMEEMTSEVLEYLLRNVKNVPYEEFIDDGYFFLSTPPNDFVLRSIKDMQLSNPVIHKIE